MGDKLDNLTLTREWMPRFLAALADTPNVTGAARIAGITRQAAYQFRVLDPVFAAAWDDAIETSVDDLEGRVFDATRIIDSPTAATLAMFLLKAHRRRVYGDKIAAELTGKDGGPIELSDAKAALLRGLVPDASGE